MRKIKNPFINQKAEDYFCFACSPNNPIGLHLEFWEDEDEVISPWTPSKNSVGYKNVIHGGIQATVLDEIGAWTVYIKCQTAGVTSALNVTYLKPIILGDAPFSIRGKVIDQNRRFATIAASIQNTKGEILAEANIKYFLFSQALAIKSYNYPGPNAFFD